ncbi:tellurium resistance protein TerD [Williamsia muralis]|uniref:Tellurium resistance protein TerD n=1 Tax=Williamsia marianensis TaxID=85044 RepID=A0A495K5N8_WILMA|nr:TerD family protein [Williamsia muralis]RKR96607.1 tellurium resistance protein TerD [Williamsia muralis]
MSVSLGKGGNVSLSKQAPNLTAVSVGLGWDVRETSGIDFDLDASAIAVDSKRKVLNDSFFVFYNNLRSPDGAIEHTGDNRTGEGDGDDELINIDLRALTPEVRSILFPVTIYDADELGQNFGQVLNAFIRVIDRADGRELARFDLSEDASTETAMVFGEIYRREDEWKFRAIGQGYESGLAGIARDFGVNVG